MSQTQMIPATPGLASTSILDVRATDYANLFAEIMTIVGNDTLLPEIFEIFGNEAAIKFLDIFAGNNVVVPSKDLVVKAVRDAHIYHELVVQETGDPHSLARLYEIDFRTVNNIAARTSEALVAHKMPGAMLYVVKGEGGYVKRPDDPPTGG